MVPPQQPKTGLTSLQTIGIAWGVVITVLVVGCLVLNIGLSAAQRASPASPASPSTTLSNAPVQACDQSSNIDPLPGTLVARVNGQPVTHFLRGQPFQLIYTGDTGDHFQPENIQVNATPFFDGALQQQDNNSGTISVTEANIAGNVLTIPTVFPWLHPDNTAYNQPGAYCVMVTLFYLQPDGQTNIGMGMISLYEESATAA